MKFDVISIAYIAIVAIMLIVGLKKGFMKVLINFIKGTLALLVAIALSRPLANFLIGTGAGTGLSNTLVTAFEGKGGIFTDLVYEATKQESISHALAELKLPEVLNNILFTIIDKLITSDYIPAEGATVGFVLGHAISYYIFLVAAFIVLFIAARIVAALLNKILNALLKIPLLGFVNKLAGGVLNAAIGVVVVCFISYGLTMLMTTNEAIATWLTQTMALNDESVTSISKYFYQNNFVAQVIAFLQTLSF